MNALKNFMLGTLLAAVLIGAQAWAEAAQVTPTELAVAAAQFGHSAQPVSVSTMVRPALVRTR